MVKDGFKSLIPHVHSIFYLAITGSVIIYALIQFIGGTFDLTYFVLLACFAYLMAFIVTNIFKGILKKYFTDDESTS